MRTKDKKTKKGFISKVILKQSSKVDRLFYKTINNNREEAEND